MSGENDQWWLENSIPIIGRENLAAVIFAKEKERDEYFREIKVFQISYGVFLTVKRERRNKKNLIFNLKFKMTYG